MLPDDLDVDGRRLACPQAGWAYGIGYRAEEGSQAGQNHSHDSHPSVCDDLSGDDDVPALLEDLGEATVKHQVLCLLVVVPKV